MIVITTTYIIRHHTRIFSGLNRVVYGKIFIDNIAMPLYDITSYTPKQTNTNRLVYYNNI